MDMSARGRRQEHVYHQYDGVEMPQDVTKKRVKVFVVFKLDVYYRNLVNNVPRDGTGRERLIRTRLIRSCT